MTMPGVAGWVVTLDPTDGPNGTQYVPNPSFEYDAVGNAPGTWGTTSLLTSGATLTTISTKSAQGAQAMKVVTGASSHEGASILLNAPGGGYASGTTYSFSIYLAGNAGGEGITLQLGTSGDNATSAITATTGFAQYSVNWTPGSTATTGVYALVKTTSATAITGYADGAMVALASLGLTYFDGDTQQAPASSYSWAGTPGASNSTRTNTRTTTDINNPTSGIQIGGTSSGQGPDWSVSQITEYAAQQSRYGSTVADYVWPNRNITIPIVLGNQSVDPNTALQSLREKVALFQREGGWLRRQRAGALNLYADVVDAQLTVPDAWGEGGHFEPGVTLTLIALPDFYGDEIVLDKASVTGVYSGVLTQNGSQAVIEGDHPVRGRVIVTDTSGNNQLSMPWGLRSRHYDSAATAALFYEAESLTPVNGAVVQTLSGASGGSVVQLVPPLENAWISMLSTDISSGSQPLTHTGSYRVWLRCYAAGTPQVRLVWGVGSLSVPVTNAAVTVPAASAFYLLDLGEIRLDAPPVGTNQWFGAIQLYTTVSSEGINLDCIYLQPLDDGAGQLTYVYEPPASSIVVTDTVGAGASVTGIGTVAWTTPNGIITGGGGASVSLGTGAESNYLKATSFGFGLASGVTVQGIEVLVTGYIGSTSYDVGIPIVNLVKAGTILTGSSSPQNGAVGAGSYGLTPETITYGSPTDLWGTTWAYSDINNSSFGAAIVAGNGLVTSSSFYVTTVQITVYYTFGTGFLVSQDAVIYADGICEARHDGMYRQGPSSGPYGPVSQVVGDLVRIPPSGVENRAVQLYVKPTRGDTDTLPDNGLDGMAVQVRYRPSWLFRP